MVARPARFREIDLVRIFRAAKKADTHVQIIIDTDGRVIVTSGVEPALAASAHRPNDFD